MAKVALYALEDPRTNQVRYVGRSKNPRRRLYMEIYSAKHMVGHCRLYAWIRSLIAAGLEPVQMILEWVDEGTWPERETYWIAHFPNLTNHAPGGTTSMGFKGGRHNAEFRRQQSERMTGPANPMYGVPSPNKGKPAWNRGRTMSDASRQKQSAWHRNHRRIISSETREKLRQNKEGEAHHNARLRQADVLEIRRLAELGLNQMVLAKMFQVSPKHVRSIVGRRRWTHI